MCGPGLTKTQLPVDLRPLLISTLLAVGGTASLPGFIPRLRSSLLQLLRTADAGGIDGDMDIDRPAPAEAVVPPPPSARSRRDDNLAWRKRLNEPYTLLYPLASKLAIINDPTPLDGDGGLKNAGVAPRWAPGLVSWVGGSLAG